MFSSHNQPTHVLCLTHNNLNLPLPYIFNPREYSIMSTQKSTNKLTPKYNTVDSSKMKEKTFLLQQNNTKIVMPFTIDLFKKPQQCLCLSDWSYNIFETPNNGHHLNIRTLNGQTQMEVHLSALRKIIYLIFRSKESRFM